MKQIIYFFFIITITLTACNSETATNDTKSKKAEVPAKIKNSQSLKKPAKPVKATNTTANRKPAKPVISSQTSAKKPSGLISAPANTGSYKAKNDGWHVSLDVALEESKKTGKPVMANFTGSDWCGWCKRLDKSVFHQPGFKKWADDNVVLLEVDSPKRFKLPEEVKQQNQGLKQAFKVRGFPSVWVFDIEKDPTTNYKITALGKTGYTKTFDEFKTNVGAFVARSKAKSNG